MIATGRLGRLLVAVLGMGLAVVGVVPLGPAQAASGPVPAGYRVVGTEALAPGSSI